MRSLWWFLIMVFLSMGVWITIGLGAGFLLHWQIGRAHGRWQLGREKSGSVSDLHFGSDVCHTGILS